MIDRKSKPVMPERKSMLVIPEQKFKTKANYA